MFSKRLLTAALEPLMLSLLADGPKYGYEIIKRARQMSGDEISWSNSQLYPLLHRLEGSGLVNSFMRPSDSGPDRKYYELTSRGHKALAAKKQEWVTMDTIFRRLWDGDLDLAGAAG